MKKTNKKGFTLAELLIVVAIIAVLVAVAIPVFTNSLDKAKIATEQANARSTYAEAASSYILDKNTTLPFTKTYDSITYSANTADEGVTWTVTLTGTGIKSDPASYTFPVS